MNFPDNPIYAQNTLFSFGLFLSLFFSKHKQFCLSPLSGITLFYLLKGQVISAVLGVLKTGSQMSFKPSAAYYLAFVNAQIDSFLSLVLRVLSLFSPTISILVSLLTFACLFPIMTLISYSGIKRLLPCRKSYLRLHC